MSAIEDRFYSARFEGSIMAKKSRTTLHSSSGKKLYAVRDEEGKFEDIQSYQRAHAQDMKRESKAEKAQKEAKGAEVPASSSATQEGVPGNVALTKVEPVKMTAAKAGPKKVTPKKAGPKRSAVAKGSALKGANKASTAKATPKKAPPSAAKKVAKKAAPKKSAVKKSTPKKGTAAKRSAKKGSKK